MSEAPICSKSPTDHHCLHVLERINPTYKSDGALRQICCFCGAIYAIVLPKLENKSDVWSLDTDKHGPYLPKPMQRWS